MSDVFISYSRQDRERAETLARAIEQRGFSVWWDRKIPPGRTFDEVIQESLAKASCVVVLWSQYSVKSDFVKDEAQRAADRGRLIPVLVDEVPIPLGFGRIQTAHLTGWREGEFHPQLEYVVESIAVFSGRGLVADERTGFRVLPPLGPPPDSRPASEADLREPELFLVPTPPEPPAAAAGKRPAVFAALGIVLVAGAAAAAYFLGLYPTVTVVEGGERPPLEAQVPQVAAEPADPVAEPGSATDPEPADVPEPAADPEPVDEPEPGPSPAELRLAAIERYLELEKAESDPAVDDREILAGYRELVSTHGESLSAEQTEALAGRVGALEASLARFEEAGALDGNGRATVGERLAKWREVAPARRVGPLAVEVRRRIEDLGQSADSAASIATPGDFVTCRQVRELRPYGEKSRFRTGKVFVFARIRAPRAQERLTFEWLSGGEVVRTKSVAISRNLDGYRTFDVESFAEPGVNEVRLYNSRGELIGLKSFEVEAAGT